MTTRHAQQIHVPHVGGKSAVILFVFTLLAFVAESQLTQISISDVTAIWNTNAFFAYIFTVKLFKLNWEARKLVAVLLATIGVMAVIYGGSQQPAEPEVRIGVTDDAARVDRRAFRTAFIGDALTLAAAIGYGLYQVFYKRYAALPFDPEFEAASDTYEHLFIMDDELSDEPEETAQGPMAEAEADTIYPPPFGLHPNLLTSAIGFCTFISLWIFIPILHYLDVEIFRLPPNAHTVLTIAAIAGSGVIFNAGFMVSLLYLDCTFVGEI
ncbi:hypothetical protein EWM64_g3063 [Hericium alpestre]|uniref:EamA domain-containing protein n=1 Tax=Hericium alpestre TaxID=135208 RepID=A0A4Z0A3P4_9AGAM|nr:hypothetical protein EWM64_g3063 [Hericium alpestre]